MFSWLQARPEGTVKGIVKGPVKLLRRPIVHPEAGEEWFRALPHERRARMNREWRQELDHSERLRQGWVRRLLQSGGRHALVFAFFNGFCPGDALVTYASAACAGFLLGLALERLHAARGLSGIAGLLAFALFLWLSRGGLGYAHMFWLVPAGIASAYFGFEREL